MTIKTNYETLQVSEDAGLLQVVINRPKVLNALNQQVITELQALVDEAIALGNTRAMVLSGAGEKSFVAGADIAAMRELPPQEALNFARLGQKLTKTIESAPFVSIAKVQGFALGGGCELAMACDIIIAADTALFGQPEVDLGLIPGFGGTQRLPSRVGLPLAMDMLVGGRKLNGTEAFQTGLVANSVPKDKLDETVSKTVKAIFRAAPGAIGETKRLARESLETPLQHGLEGEASSFANCFSREESKEGIAAFLEKRKASFSL